MTKPVTRKMAVDCLLDYAGVYTELVRDPRTDHRTLIRAMICQICNEPLLPGQNIQFDHCHSHVMGGPHEYQNLRPVHADCHKIKTKADIQANAKVKRILADKPSKRPMRNSGKKIPSRPFSKTRAMRNAIKKLAKAARL